MTREWNLKDLEHETDERFTALLESIERLVGPGSVKLPLSMAARLVELAAYEAARSQTPEGVSRLILMAADLERISDTVARPVQIHN